MSAQPSEEQTRMGRWMMLGMWVLALALTTLVINQWLERRANPNHRVVTTIDGGKRSITLKRSRHGHYLLNGTINGASATFLVDTGATNISVPVAVAARANLARGDEVLINTANGISTAYSTHIDLLTMGELEFANARAHINPGLDNAVLLGMNVLRHYELIQRGDELIIREP